MCGLWSFLKRLFCSKKPKDTCCGECEGTCEKEKQ
jgi:hypothetical protein